MCWLPFPEAVAGCCVHVSSARPDQVLVFDRSSALKRDLNEPDL